jgi:hypothetical protein
MIPDLPPALVGPSEIPWLTSIAGVLPPFHRAGFECRLAADETAVDLQQGIYGTHGEPARLARILASAEPLDDVWDSVRRLAERWSVPGDIVQRGVNEVWLELDAVPDATGAPTLTKASPSVFAVLEQAGEGALPLARELLALLLVDDESRRCDETLTRLALACPPPARLTHVGVMLGRPVRALRAHISHLRPQEIGTYLDRIGWEWDRAAAVDAATMLLEHGDWVVLCLDVVEDRVVRIGLECFFGRKHGVDPGWPPLLRRLSELGLSSRAKADALLEWPRALTPPNDPAHWPGDLVAQGLLTPSDTFGAFDRRLSHVKLTFGSGDAVSAKAYFGYVHVWMQGAGLSDSMTTPGAPNQFDGSRR